MKRNLKMLFMLFLILPIAFVMSGCFGENIGTKVADADRPEVEAKISAALADFWGEGIDEWDGFQISIDSSTNTRKQSAFDDERATLSFAINMRVIDAEEEEDVVASGSTSFSMTERAAHGSFSIDARTSLYIAEGNVYDTITRTYEEESEDISLILGVPLAMVMFPFTYYFDWDNVADIYVRNLSGSRTQYTLDLDLEKVTQGFNEETHVVSGTERMTIILNGDDEVVELRASSNVTVVITTGEDDDRVVRTTTTKATLSLREFTGTISAPRNLANFNEGTIIIDLDD
jgi:hypothetical protein